MPSQIKIVDGPSKFDLMVSLFNGNKPPLRMVKFSILSVQGDISVTANIDVSITLIAQADNSGENWIFNGCTRDRAHGAIKRIVGHYSSQKQTGFYQFEEETTKQL